VLLLVFKRALSQECLLFFQFMVGPGIMVIFLLLSEFRHLFAKLCSSLLYKAFFLCVAERFELLLLPLRFWLPKAS